MKKAFILGFARSGYAAAKLLLGKGYTVTVNDFNTEQNAEHMEELTSLGADIVLGNHPDDLFNGSYELLVKNPGITNKHKYVDKAKTLKIPVINEMELAYRYFPAGVKIIGITGTNGKTTTTTLTYEFLKDTDRTAYLTGNIGYPVCSFVPKLKEGDIVVMEVSDHQLCNIDEFKADVAILTNLYEAHIDFHGTYEIYKSMKKRIFDHHTSGNVAILNSGNMDVMDLTDDIISTKKYFSSVGTGQDCYIENDCIYYGQEKIIALDEIKIKGMHNYENIMAAIMAVKEFDIDSKFIVNVLKTFNGVEHRQEFVKTINGIDFYNDSKATNIISTQKALSAFSQPTVLLLGGLDRRHSFDDLKPFLENVPLIVSYGETKDRIADFAAECGIESTVVDTLPEATQAAYKASEPGYVVLLSPACASWDQFSDFESRGNMFKEYVEKLNSEI